MKYGYRFKYYRKKAGLKQFEAAEKIGVKNYQLGNYETDRSEPSIHVLIKMSDVYKVSIDKLLGHSTRNIPSIEESLKIEACDYDELKKLLNEMTSVLNNKKR